MSRMIRYVHQDQVDLDYLKCVHNGLILKYQVDHGAEIHTLDEDHQERIFSYYKDHDVPQKIDFNNKKGLQSIKVRFNTEDMVFTYDRHCIIGFYDQKTDSSGSWAAITINKEFKQYHLLGEDQILRLHDNDIEHGKLISIAPDKSSQTYSIQYQDGYHLIVPFDCAQGIRH